MGGSEQERPRGLCEIPGRESMETFESLDIAAFVRKESLAAVPRQRESQDGGKDQDEG